MKNAIREVEKEKKACFLTDIKESNLTEVLAGVYFILTYPYVLTLQGALGLYNLVFGFKEY